MCGVVTYLCSRYPRLQFRVMRAMGSVYFAVSKVCMSAGVDLQKDVLDLMGFKPLAPNVQLMDSRCFSQ